MQRATTTTLCAYNRRECFVGRYAFIYRASLHVFQEVVSCASIAGRNFVEQRSPTLFVVCDGRQADRSDCLTGRGFYPFHFTVAKRRTHRLAIMAM